MSLYILWSNGSQWPVAKLYDKINSISKEWPNQSDLTQLYIAVFSTINVFEDEKYILEIMTNVQPDQTTV